MPPTTWDLGAIAPRLEAMSKRWAKHDLSERASLQTFIIELCGALGVAAPGPDDAGRYQFELPVKVTDRDGKETTNFIDCWKAEHFALEGKATGDDIPDENRLRKAFGQVRNYVAQYFDDAPPFLMVLDVPRHLIVWDRFSGRYGDFAAGRRINLPSLHTRPEDIALLCDIFEQPRERDPNAKAQAVTKEIAAKLAELASALEDRTGDQERVARFLMRCVFSCFAEDVGLLPKGLFERTLVAAREAGPTEVGESLSLLWKTMDEGGRFGAEKVQHFNGHFFKTVEALPLEAREIDLLIEAAHFDWSRVEPSIFGTLLVRALDPEERHRLGAEYTPREYIERLVEPTVVEPIRERWTAVQAAVLQMNPIAPDESKAKKGAAQTAEAKVRKAAITELLKFHEWLRGLSFLDPACGSGNFLYVTMAAVKRIELEVLNEIQRLSGGQGGLVLDEVHPRQFHGIEVKMWAREIAELTLWIGYHQFWRETHGGRTPPTPILEDTGTLECRDAVLAWDSVVHKPERDRPDPTPRIKHPVTGELVPDPGSKVRFDEYVNARPAKWPRADFIVGNPPYIGAARVRLALGDGYAEALHSAYPGVPNSADFVMHWWSRAAAEVAGGRTIRSGLITTSSISQRFNRAVIQGAADAGAEVSWAITSHPWTGEVDTAAVTVAMTVVERAPRLARLLSVNERGEVISSHSAPRLNVDLTIHADVASTTGSPLRSNAGLCFAGLEPNGEGFILTAARARALIDGEPGLTAVVRPYLNGRDLSGRSRNAWIIDFGTRSEAEARTFPHVFQIVADAVKPVRAANTDKRRRDLWWQFGRNNPELRAAVSELRRFIVTVKTSRRRFFTFVSDVVPDSKLNCIASDSPFVLGCLSSSIHLTWSRAAGGMLGAGNDPTYNKESSFDPFPFPSSQPVVADRIATLAYRLDDHRHAAIARDERVTMTGMYNVVDKLRSGESLSTSERELHEAAGCGLLKDLHDELDRLVAEAYGWPWPIERDEILARLVSLHGERVAEESAGTVRWLRPNYQIPAFGVANAAPSELALGTTALPATSAGAARQAWPATAVDQLTAIGAAVGQAARSVDELVAGFSGAKRDLVSRHLETLAMMGEVTLGADNRYRPALRVA